jgi:hypothetical protein
MGIASRQLGCECDRGPHTRVLEVEGGHLAPNRPQGHGIVVGRINPLAPRVHARQLPVEVVLTRMGIRYAHGCGTKALR